MNKLDIKLQATKSAKWTAFSNVIVSLLEMLRLFIMAKLLSPDDFGLMAMVMVVLGFAQVYSDMGIGAAIIHRQDITTNQLSSLYWLNIFAGFIICLIIYFLQPFIIIFYNEPRLNDLLPWVVIIFLTAPFGQQFQFLLQKELSFKIIALIDIFGSTVNLLVAISFAILGKGALALVLGRVSDSIIKSLAFSIIGFNRWRPLFHFKLCDLNGYIRFGFYQMGDKTISYFNSNLDKILIGSLLGSQLLGYYSLAWNLAIQPVSKINPVITRVAFPVFSLIQKDKNRLRSGYLSIIRLLSTINSPLLIGLAAVSQIFVPTLFGGKWNSSIFLIQLLCFVSLFRSLGNPVGALLLSKGRADISFKWNLMLLTTQSIGIFIGANYFGIEGVAFSLLFLQIAYQYPAFKILINPIIECKYFDFIRSFITSIFISISMAFILYIILQFYAIISISYLVLLIFIGATTYFIFFYVFQKTYILYLFDLFFKNKGTIQS